ncbi:MAG TPA: hypothetical protein DDW17_01125 [Deltaproteobacteria bacterium]|nr:hypothetical protein [Deltaproteobacteria bacterium]
MKMRKCGRIFLFLFMLIFSSLEAGFTEDHTDNLLLTGFIKSFDANIGVIMVNITSEGCEGLREFKIPEDAKEDLDASLIGKRIQFYINSNTCERGKVYDIIFER